MIFNYDKENKSIGFNGKNLKNAGSSIKDFFTKKQDIIQAYKLTKDENKFFEKIKGMNTEQLSAIDEKTGETVAVGLSKNIAGNSEALQEYVRVTDAAKISQAGFAQSQQTVIKGTTKFSAALRTAGGVVKSFVATLGSMAVTMAVSWVIGKVFEGIDYLLHYDENIIKKGQEAQESIDNTVKSLQEQKKAISDLSSKYSDTTSKEISDTEESLESLAKKYTELKKGVDPKTNENISLSTDGYQEYLDISNQLASIFPSLTASTDNQGNAILNLGNNAEKSAKQIKEMYNSSILAAHVDIGDNLQATYEGNKTSAEEAETQKTGYDNAKGDFEKELEYKNKLLSTPIVNSIDSLINNQNLFDEDDTNVTLADIQLTNEQQEALEYAVEQYNKNIEVSAEEIKNGRKKLGDAFTVPIIDQNSNSKDKSDNKNPLLFNNSVSSLQDLNVAENIKKSKEIDIDFGPSGALLENIDNWTQEDMNKFNSYYHDHLKVLMGERLDELGQQIKEYGEKSGKLDGQIKEASAKTAATIKEYVNTDLEFLDLSSDTQKAINDYIVNSMDLSDVDINEEYGDIDTFYYRMFTKVFQALGKEKAQKAFDKILSLNTSELSLNDYEKSVSDYIKGVTTDEDLQNSIKETTGVSAKIEDAKKDAERLKKIFPKAEKYIASLPVDDLIDYADYVDQGFDTSNWDTFVKAAEKAKKAAEKAKKAAADTKSDTTFASLLSDTSDEGLSKKVDTFQSDISSIEATLQSLKTGDFKDSDLTDLMQQFPQLIGTTDDLQTALNKIKLDNVKSLFKNIDDGLENATDKELQNAKAFKQNLLKSVDFTDTDKKAIRDELISQIMGDTSDSSLLREVKGIQVNDFMKQYASMLSTNTGMDAFYKAMLIDPELITKNQEEVTKAWMENLPTTKDIIQDTDIQSQLTDYQDKYQSLYQAQKDLKNGLMTGSTRKTFLDKFPDLAKYAGNTEDLSSAIDDLMDSMDSDVTNQFTDAIKALNDAGKYADASALQSYVDAVLDGAHDIEGAYQKIAGLKIPTPQYAELKEALESSNEGDLYNELLSQYKTAKEAWKKGEVGTDDFKSFASIISPTGVSDAVNFGENQAMFERYFQDTSTGVENFLEDLQKLNLASNESGHWTSTLGNNLDEMRDAAQRLNMGFEPFMMMFGRLEDYGATTDFFTTEEEGQQHLSDLYQQIADKKLQLAKIKADPDLAGDQSAIDSINKDLDELYARVENTTTGMEELPKKAAYYEAKNLEEAKSVVTQMQDEINQAMADGNDEQVKILKKTRDQYLKENGYILKEQPQGPIQQGSIENPTAREFTNPTKFGDYETVIKKIQNATDEQTSSLEENLKVLSKYSESQLSGINLSDGQYDSGFEDAERALDNLTSTFGLTKEQALQLAAVLSDMGLIKVTPDVELTTLNDQLKETDKTLKEIEKESGIKIDTEFDIGSMTPDEMDKKVEEYRKVAQQLNDKGYTDQANQVNQTADNMQEYSKTVRIQEVVEKDADAERLQQLIDSGDTEKIEAEYGIKVDGEEQLKQLNEDLATAKANKDAQIDMTVKLDESQFKQLLGDGENASIDVTANNKEAKEKIKEAKEYADHSKGTIKIDGNSYSAISKADSAVKSINGMTGTIKIDANIDSMTKKISSELAKPRTIDISANVHTNVSGAVKGAAASAVGSMIRVAHASGTAYNVLNYTPAHANGKVALNSDENALVNEVGSESIVRNGKWMLIPGGAHFENLKKGDIIFNAQQTSELINSGRVMSGGGHARAYASGTGSPDLLGWNKTRTQVGNQSSSSANSTAIDKNTTSTKNNTDVTDDNTEKVKKSSKVWDWVEIRIKSWGKKVQAIADKITDYIDKSTKRNLLKQQMNKMNYQIGANVKGGKAYLKKANSIAKKYTYYNSDGTAIETNVPKKYQKLVQNGTYSIEDMDTSTDAGKAMAEAIEQYQTWYNKYEDCKQAVVDLKKEQMELFEQWANMPTEEAEKNIERITAGFNGLNAAQARLSASQSGGSTQAAMVKYTNETKSQAVSNAENAEQERKKADRADKSAKNRQNRAKSKLAAKSANILKHGGLSAEQKAAVKAGKKIDTTGMTGKKKARANAYNKAVTLVANRNKKRKTTQANLKTAETNAVSTSAISKYLTDQVNSANSGYNQGDELSYMNAFVDQNVVNLKKVSDERQKAYEQAATNRVNFENKYTAAVKNKKDLIDIKKGGKKIAADNASKLSDAQKKALNSGKKVSLKGVKDKKLLGQLKAYNSALKSLPNAITEVSKLEEQRNIVIDAEATAAENAAQAATEAAQAEVQATKDKFDNVKNYYEAQLSYQEQLNAEKEKGIELSNAHGNYEKTSDYDVKINNEKSTRSIKVEEKKKFEQQLKEGIDNGTIKEGTLEWIEMQTQIVSVGNEIADCDTKIEELKQQQIGVYYEEQFDRAIEKINQFKDRLDTLNGIISDDMKIDKNTGLLTELGATSVMINRNQFAANQKEIQKLLEKENDVKRRYANGEDMSSEFGEKTYDQYIKDIQSQYNSLISSNSSLQNDMLSLIKNQAQAELDVLNKVIDKRKEALSAKKEYYDYDKTLKSKTKDIQLLERQAAALQGSTNAEDKARLAKIKEQLSDAREDLSDTITDHAYSMQSDALDKLSSDMSEDFEKWSNDISSNVEKMTGAINDAVKNAGMSTTQVVGSLKTVLKNFGLTDDQIKTVIPENLTGYASGTDYVPKSGIYRTNENGMESVLSKKYGTLTFLNQGDKVFTADFTERLIDNAGIATQSNQPQFGEMYKDLMNSLTNVNQTSGDMTVNFYIDGAKDIDTLKTEIYGTMKQLFKEHDKKQVRDYRSLR